MRPYLLGVPPYANTAPLYHYLRPSRTLAFRYGVPTQLNAWVREGAVGLSLVSSHFFLQHQDLLVALPDFSVAVLGRVYSVNLFHKRPLSELRRVALTTESATSVALLKWLLEEEGVRPLYERQAGGLELLKEFDGVLLIGDRAITAYAGLLDALPPYPEALPTRFGEVWVSDLSMLWFQKTRLPFVFALWAARKDLLPPKGVVERMRKARRRGLAHLGRVARREADRLRVHPALMEHYLWNFRYHLEAPDLLGLEAFAQAVGLPYRPRFSE
ncbi:menaquinone biosynthetic enzyme MqnA/MqnD family protein [Thermus filiformis]|uniref:Chorismate dehydratase n=1 Tax=Thermus filiformis TaxID=276 RepID=A0A0A2WU74_THEFI|nr:menaquinone biosynthesis protein [Thermus filiformis]KGQ22322.1 periplasmic solute-binding protein [Thermus filiformis]